MFGAALRETPGLFCHHFGMVSTDVVEYRPGFGRALAIAAAVIAALALGVSVISHPAETWRFIPPVALVVVAIWAAYWWPAVIVAPSGVSVKNILRTIDLPWPAIQRIDTRFALTLYTAYGSYSAWAAPAPGRAEVARSGAKSVFREHSRGLPESTVVAGTMGPGDLPNSPSGAAAMLVRSRWEELRDAGLLDDPRLERSRPVVHWHWGTIAALALLAVASVVTLAFVP